MHGGRCDSDGSRFQGAETPLRLAVGGFGHVHRAVAGDDGVDFYVTYLLPPGSATHVVSADPLPECSS
jgi:hypothetical protein